MTLVNRPLVVLVALVFVTALALWYIWQGWQLTDLSSKVIASRLEQDTLSSRKNHLRLEVARVWSLEEIERIAKERLAMKKPQFKTLVLPRLTKR